MDFINADELKRIARFWFGTTVSNKMPGHFDGRAPHQHVRQASATDRTHDDQIGVRSSRPINDFVSRITAEHVLLTCDILQVYGGGGRFVPMPGIAADQNAGVGGGNRFRRYARAHSSSDAQPSNST